MEWETSQRYQNQGVANLLPATITDLEVNLFESPSCAPYSTDVNFFCHILFQYIVNFSGISHNSDKQNIA